jgi:hypothetical protein
VRQQLLLLSRCSNGRMKPRRSCDRSWSSCLDGKSDRQLTLNFEWIGRSFLEEVAILPAFATAASIVQRERSERDAVTVRQ